MHMIAKMPDSVLKFSLHAAAGPSCARALNTLTKRFKHSGRQIVVKGGNAEQIHTYRVALRKLRSVYRASGRLRPPATRRALMVEFRWLSARTSAVRDIDVLLATLSAYATRVDDTTGEVLRGPLSQHLTRRAAQARADLQTTLRSKRYAILLNEWKQMVNEIAQTEVAPDSLVPHIDKMVRRLRDNIREVSVRKDESATLHEVRKQVKRLRYALVTFRSLFTADIDASLDGLEHLQDALGAYCDIDTHRRVLPTLLGASPLCCEQPCVATVVEALSKEHHRRFARALAALKRFQRQWSPPAWRRTRSVATT